MSLTRLARRKSFQCMHRYALEGWTEAQNRAEFGACFTPTGHGHNYEMEAYFEGQVDPTTGMIANLVDIDALMSEVVNPLDGKHLNFDVAAFAKRVPTTEALAEYLATELITKKKKLKLDARLVKVRLYEYEDLWVDVWP